MKNLLSKVLPDGKFWTDAWSLVEGCTPISPGCANCWLAGIYSRNLPNLTPGLVERVNTPAKAHDFFNGKIVCREDRLDTPLRARKPRVYAIWSDLFHERVPEEFRDRAFNRMSAAERHHFIIITKRPHEAVPFLQRHAGRSDRPFGFQKWPLSNVTILVTMEDQQRADERAPHALQLADLGWRVGALCEPLLGPIRLDRIHEVGKTLGGANFESWESALNGKRPDFIGDGPDVEGYPRLSWLITGGESGHGARPVHPDWVRSLRDQAQAASVPFMFKQWGEWTPCRNDDPDWPGIATDFDLPHCPQSAATHSWGDHVFSLRAGKRNTGRSLDGREWLEVPE